MRNPVPLQCRRSTFGEIDLTQNVTFDLTGTLTVVCSGTPHARVRYCPNIGAGTGGAAAGGDPRYMLNGVNQLNFNIYRNNGFNLVWGSYFWFFQPPSGQVLLDGAGNGSGTMSVFIRISAGQTALPAGTYSTSFAGGHTLFAYAYASGANNCAVIGTLNAVQVPFTIQARNTGSCAVTAADMNFGTLGTLTTNYDATSSISVTCTTAAQYQVGLNGGLTGATDPTQRKMALGAEQITYGLYQDAARSTAWGDTLNVNTVSGTGTGSAQSLTVYGRIPPQTTPTAGTYSDTIVVTVTY